MLIRCLHHVSFANNAYEPVFSVANEYSAGVILGHFDKGDIGDAIRYLRDMRRELNDNLDYLESTKEGVAIQEVLRRNLEESLEDYKARVSQLENELKKH